MEKYERAAAMPSSLTYVLTKHSSGLYCISCTARASSLPLRPAVCRIEHLPILWGNTSRRNGKRQRSFEIRESICGLEESQNLKDCELSTGEFSTTTSLHVVDRKNYPLQINLVRCCCCECCILGINNNCKGRITFRMKSQVFLSRLWCLSGQWLHKTSS